MFPPTLEPGNISLHTQSSKPWVHLLPYLQVAASSCPRLVKVFLARIRRQMAKNRTKRDNSEPNLNELSFFVLFTARPSSTKGVTS